MPNGPYGPQGPVNPNDLTWAMFAYLGAIIAGFIPALVIYFVKRHESPFIRYHAAQMVNYQLTLLIQVLASFAVAGVLFLLTEHPAWFVLVAPAYLNAVIGQWVFIVLGALKSGKGQFYRFPTPFCFRMVR
ncbi:DUF4870 domain-containing protein [Actinomadura kijaniata]|uniref:DUF4870 domain-containing protein n=1 Tax=Actinomadura kijaniata TaxID=46161 RepID=UPI003F1D09F8